MTPLLKRRSEKKTKLKGAIYRLIQTRSQFFIIKNAYQFIHSHEYDAFLEIISYFCKEFNDDQLDHKCVFFFVEEEINLRYDKTAVCLFCEDEPSFDHVKQEKNFHFLDLGIIKDIDKADVKTWLEEDCTDKQKRHIMNNDEDDAALDHLIEDGNPQTLIPRICEKIEIDYNKNERIWLKY